MMIVLLLISVVGFIIFMERTFFLHRGQIRSMAFLEGIKNLLRKRRLIEALTVCEETPGPLANIVKAALLHFQSPEDEMRRAVQEAALLEIPVLERRIGTIATIARIAPLVGLLGTVLAGVQILYRLNAAGVYADNADTTGFLAQALLSTAAGLAIGILAQTAYHFLLGRMRALVHDLEYAGHHLMQFILKDLAPGRSSGPADPSAPPAAAAAPPPPVQDPS